MASRIKIQFKDSLKHSPRIRAVRCRLIAMRDGRRTSGDPQKIAQSIHKLCVAARNATSPASLLAVEDRIKQRVRELKGREFDWLEFEPNADVKVLDRAVILKPYKGPKEKGVILIAFDYQWARLMKHYDKEVLRRLSERYWLVVSTVWAEPHCLMNYVLPSVWPGERIFATISDPDDEAIIPRFSEKYVVAPLLCSNWVNPAWYKQVPFEEKNVDFFMLANFGEYKRHWELFRAMKKMPRETRVVLIGQHNGKRDDNTIRAEARAFGIGPERFEIKRNPTDEEVFDTLARAKTSLIFSLREGSCMAIVESMFANTPVGMFHDAKVGSRRFINDQTGRFLKHVNLAQQLLEFRDQAQKYQPRKWADENRIDCFGSTETLNRTIKDALTGLGHEWTQDIAVHMWRPNPRLVEAQDRERMRQDYDFVMNELGIDLDGYPE